jgi:hypothetical protein
MWPKHTNDKSIQWVKEADSYPDTLYLESIPENDFSAI